MREPKYALILMIIASVLPDMICFVSAALSHSLIIGMMPVEVVIPAAVLTAGVMGTIALAKHRMHLAIFTWLICLPHFLFYLFVTFTATGEPGILGTYIVYLAGAWLIVVLVSLLPWPYRR